MTEQTSRATPKPTLGYQVCITLHADMRYAIITSMPGNQARTLPAADLDRFLSDIAKDPTPGMIGRWFEKAGGA